MIFSEWGPGIFINEERNKEEMMIGKGYCSDCKKEVDVSYCKYWSLGDHPKGFHKTCCECGGSNVEFLVGPLATSDIPAMMGKLEALWEDFSKHCHFSFAETLALILPAVLGDVAFTDEELDTALDEVLAATAWTDKE